MNPRPEVAAVINLHDEGRKAHGPLASVSRATAELERKGVAAEVIVVADRPDEATRAYVAEHLRPGWKLALIDEADLARARNKGVAESSAPFIAFLDGDDLWSEDWLVRAYEHARLDRNAIYHPEIAIFFGHSYGFMILRDSESASAEQAALMSATPFGPSCFASRDIFERCPYVPARAEAGFGFHDWHWHCETIAAGYAHRAVRGTFYLRRAKPPAESLSERQRREGLRIAASRLFAP